MVVGLAVQQPILDPNRHPFYQHSEAAFFIALEGDEVVGRLSVLDNARYNKHHPDNPPTAFFYHFDVIEDRAVCRALCDAAFKWARDGGLERMWGPKGLIHADGQGVLVYVPITEAEADMIGNRILAVADPRLIKLMVKEKEEGDEIIGFMLTYPDLSAAIQRCRGRMWPWGWFHLLREFRCTQWLNLNGIAILERYRGLGGQRAAVRRAVSHAHGQSSVPVRRPDAGPGDERPHGARVGGGGRQAVQEASGLLSFAGVTRRSSTWASPQF